MAAVRKVHSGRSPESLKPTREVAGKIVPTRTVPEKAEPSKKEAAAAAKAPWSPESMDAHIEYEMSPQIDKLAKAFVAFRAVCPNMDKDRKGYNYKYTTLANVIETSREPLKKQGLAVMQFPIAGPGSLGVITTIMHESGQYIRSRFLMPIPGLSGTNVTQDAGAAITYARRYALSAVLCVASDDDTDAR